MNCAECGAPVPDPNERLARSLRRARAGYRVAGIALGAAAVIYFGMNLYQFAG